MDKKLIKIAFVGFWPGFDKVNNFFTEILGQKYDVLVIDVDKDKNRKNEVEYLFYSAFSDDYLDYNCIRIFYTGENVFPNMNECDYAIGFDYCTMGDRYIRFPLYLAFYSQDVENMLKKHTSIDETNIKRKFCSMVVSNSIYADPIRKEFFEKISEYKKVDSGGRFLNNIGLPEGVADKIAFQSQYKFCLAFENSMHPGYCTEKIVQAFASNTVPIYWGDPCVSKEFNSKSFINCNEYNSIDETIDAIKEIDENDNLYMTMLKEPAADQQRIDILKEEFRKWLLHIVEQDYDKAYRRNLSGRCYALEQGLIRRREDERKKQLEDTEKANNIRERIKHTMKKILN